MEYKILFFSSQSMFDFSGFFILPNMPKRPDLFKPNSTYIFGKTPMVTYIGGVCLDDL